MTTSLINYTHTADFYYDGKEYVLYTLSWDGLLACAEVFEVQGGNSLNLIASYTCRDCDSEVVSDFWDYLDEHAGERGFTLTSDVMFSEISGDTLYDKFPSLRGVLSAFTID